MTEAFFELLEDIRTDLKRMQDWTLARKAFCALLLFLASLALIAFAETLMGWVVPAPEGENSTASSIAPIEWARNAVWIVISIVGGIMGLWLAIQRTETATEQAKTALDQQKISERGERNGRYQKGAEMLGSEQMSVRLAGIYSLKSVALEDPENYLEQVTELLCAFVRHPTIVKGEEQAEKVRSDVEIVVQTLGSDRWREYMIAIGALEHRLDFKGATLIRGEIYLLNLTSADFGECNLRDSSFGGGTLIETNFWRANLTDCNFVHSNIKGANFTSSNISNVDFMYATCSDRTRFVGAWAWDDQLPNCLPAAAKIEVFKSTKRHEYQKLNLNAPPSRHLDCEPIGTYVGTGEEEGVFIPAESASD